ncbi:MAG: metallophosphoesterase [Chitinophagaceae bacterium]
MRSPAFLMVILVIMLLLDVYVFQAVKLVSNSASPRTKLIVYAVYWSLSAITLIILLLMTFTHYETWPRVLRTYLFATVLGLFFAKVIAVVFFLIDDIRRLIQWASGKLFFSDTEAAGFSGEGISRSLFLSWLGIGAGSALFGSLVYGFSNKYNYKIRRIKLAYDNLPKSFKGLKILQISDIHSGSFTNKEAVMHGVDMAMKENADLILFTGDLVNDRATEMENYMDVFSKLKAPMGVFSTLGNHDYGDYVNWESAAAKSANLEDLKKVHAALGWRLMMNEHTALDRNGEQIALIGIENWGAKARFPKYGRMDLAYPGTEKYPFKILMSHDPSHWHAEVQPKYGDIDLTLAGHTHGMQFGVEIPGFKWSPVEYVYKEWAGLYEQGKQKLYVNRGYGFIGYPGRVGILPEITVIELT